MSRKINRKPIVSPVKIVRPPDSNNNSELKGGSSSAIITDFKNSITELLKKIPKFSPDNNAPQNPPPSSHDNLR